MNEYMNGFCWQYPKVIAKVQPAFIKLMKGIK